MIKNYGYTIIELTIVIVLLSIILGFTVNVKNLQRTNNVKKTLSEIQNYTKAIKTFKRKYGFLPGDIQKTQIFDLSTDNTDGNANGFIEDKNQQNDIYEENIKMDGEIANFWTHLHKAGFIKHHKNMFPYVDFLRTWILIFSDKNKNYYHLSVSGTSESNEIETNNNLTPYHAYLIDRKIDDGLPFSGTVQVVGGNRITVNRQNMQHPSKNCATEFEYLTIFKTKLCQLIIEVDI